MLQVLDICKVSQLRIEAGSEQQNAKPMILYKQYTLNSILNHLLPSVLSVQKHLQFCILLQVVAKSEFGLRTLESEETDLFS
jgi:hypothetical protein